MIEPIKKAEDFSTIKVKDVENASQLEGMPNDELNLWCHREFLYGLNLGNQNILAKMKELADARVIDEKTWKFVLKVILGEMMKCSRECNKYSDEIGKRREVRFTTTTKQ